MFTAGRKGRLAIIAVAATAALGLAGCSSGDPLAAPSAGGGGSASAGADATAIVIGSANFPEAEILGEIYAQALEGAGLTVQRQFNIGARDVYLASVESGEVDLISEYTGNLLQYYDAETTATSPEQVDEELASALPDGLRVLDVSDASDQDSYVVTKDFAQENDLTSLGDLSGLPDLVLGGNSELESRPYGPDGLKRVYDVDVEFQAIDDQGGPATKAALDDGTITLGNIYTSDPDIGNYTRLEDPENLFLPQNIVPLANDGLTDDAEGVIDEVIGTLTQEKLIQLNQDSNDGQSPADIATAYLEANPIG